MHCICLPYIWAELVLRINISSFMDSELFLKKLVFKLANMVF